MRKHPSVQMTREIYGRTALPYPFVGADLGQPWRAERSCTTKRGATKVAPYGTAMGALAGGKGPMGDAAGGHVHLKGGDGGVQKLDLLGVGPGVHLGRQRAYGLLGIA